jgi:hypothetical protein
MSYKGCIGGNHNPRSGTTSPHRWKNRQKGSDMGRIFKILLGLVILGLVAVIVFGYIGDLSPTQEEQRIPVSLGE